MRMLHVIGSLTEVHGGPSKAAVEMAQAVADQGHEVSVHSTDLLLDPARLPPGRVETLGGVDIHYHHAVFGKIWYVSRGLCEALASEIPKADIVEIHSLYLFHDWISWRYCRRHGIPYILRPHGTLDPFIWRRHRARKWVIERLFMNRVIQDAAALHFTSEEEMELARPYCFDVPGFVSPLGLRAERYGRMKGDGRFRALFGDDPDFPLILFLGRLNFKKGLDLLTDAFSRLHASGSPARLLIAGPDDGMEGPIRDRLRDAGVLDRVRFTGMLRGEDKAAAFADSDLFVLPSYTENFGIAVVEAMASGVPVLISDRVNIWREIEADGAGRVVPCDVESLSIAMSEMLADPDGLQCMAERGLATARERFDWRVIGRGLAQCYQGILDGAR